MYFSKLFVPTSKQDPSDAELASHKLMLKSGMIKKTAAGIYNWLPFGLKVVKKVEDIVRKNLDLSGAQEILMPRFNLQSFGKSQKGLINMGKSCLNFKIDLTEILF